MFGASEIARSLAVAGAKLLWLALFHLAPLTASALGWWVVLAPVRCTAFRTTLVLRWVAESINHLLPAVQVGGNVVRARRLARSGVPAPLADASVIVDVTLHLLGQVLFTLVGLVLLPAGTRGTSIAGSVGAGVVLSAAGVAAFWVLQRRGALAAATATIVRNVFPSADASSVVERAGATDEWIRRLYRLRRAVAVAEVWHVLSWVLGAGETFLALRFLGHPVTPRTALVIESVGEAIRTASFPVPGALGVQEGGLVVVGRLFGLPPEVAMALSFAKRVRELTLGVPGLVAWQAPRLASALARRRAALP